MSALASGWIGAVLVGGPIGLGAPTAEALIAGGIVAGVVALLVRHTAPAGRRTVATAYLLWSIPLMAVVVAMYVSDQFVHLATRSSALGWVLVASLPLLAAIAAKRNGGSQRGVDFALGCAIGVAAAALIHVAAADTTTFDLRWALVGSIVGAGTVGGVGLATPHPALRTPLGTTWRTAPFAAAWVMAIITAIPAAPRHELSTSAGAQVLAVTIAGGLLLVVLAFWYGEGAATAKPAWAVFRLGMGRFAPRIATLSLFLVGGLQAASYSEVTIDDLGQFWIAANTLGAGSDYPIGMHRAGLPGLPILMAAAFAAFGRTFPAALAPMFLANTLLPWLLYRASITAGAGRAAAFAISVLAVVLPVTQIYSLSAADPEAVFIALLAAAVWALCHVLQTRRPRQSVLVLGILAGALAITRPEGPLYGGLILLAALGATRSRWGIIGCCLGGGVAAPIVALSLANLGRPWPTYSVNLSFANLVENAVVIVDITAPKVARVLLLNDLRFATLIAILLALFVIGSVHLTHRHWAFVVLPVAAAANVLVKLSISSYGVPLRTDFPPEFVRHISYPMPAIALLTSVGVSLLAALVASRGTAARGLGQIVGIAAATYLVAGSLYVLGTPEEFHHGNRSGSLLADRIYVNAPELWMNPFELPGPEWDFFEYRARLFAWYAPFDNHSDTAGMAYQTLTGAVAAMGFAALLVAAPNRRPRAALRDDGTEE
ncbi:MAG: glycosyltransferase family 39 protein [Chloroflexota bacterium]|nr:glycosyltransferase family 39 protein [Chloroflexota bacterium]